MKMDSSAFVADEKLIRALQPYASPIACGQDRILFNQGDAPTGVYIVHSGEVILTMRSPLGDVVMSMPAANHSLLGVPGLIGSVGYSLSAFAKSGAEVSFVPRDDFFRLMLAEPSISMMILQVLAAEVRTARLALVEM
jgi:CRP-like cAMP-binding protein